MTHDAMRRKKHAWRGLASAVRHLARSSVHLRVLRSRSFWGCVTAVRLESSSKSLLKRLSTSTSISSDLLDSRSQAHLSVSTGIADPD